MQSDIWWKAQFRPARLLGEQDRRKVVRLGEDPKPLKRGIMAASPRASRVVRPGCANADGLISGDQCAP